MQSQMQKLSFICQGNGQDYTIAEKNCWDNWVKYILERHIRTLVAYFYSPFRIPSFNVTLCLNFFS